MASKYKLLCVKNFSSNNIPINDESSVVTYHFDNLNDAKSFADKFLSENNDSYIKIWNSNTNELILENKNTTN